MKRKKSQTSFVLCVSAAVLIYACGRTTASPVQNPHHNIAVGKFQAAIQQQNFVSILTSIEDRLRSLDNIYSMQLSQTLETKLDQYSRRLEALDTKMIRLEALIMLNLDKISENISTKNYKDEVTRTTLLRKMDTVYEGIGHRLGYIERKSDTHLTKIQTKLDATLTRLEKLEENMMTRDSDMEAEISDAIFAIDDLKTMCTNMEEKLHNITSDTLNVTKDMYKSMEDLNVISRKSMNVLHDNIIDNLKFMNNRTARQVKLVEDNNVMLKSMKSELKEDFNDYANKVADMNSYMWKNSDTIGDDLKLLQMVVNNTKTEVQNGVRSLMVQIGKISSKENVVSSDDSSLDEMNKNLKNNFERILTNQDLFLESCHRLQMDESQIESEISGMLEKLIDMLEKKMASEMKDIKNLERVLKTQDSRLSRNVYQINSNVISLFEKSTINAETLSREIQKIGNNLEALFAFVQSTITAGASHSSSLNTEALQDQLTKIENMILTIYNSRAYKSLSDNDLKDEIMKQFRGFSKSLSSMESHVNTTLNEAKFEKIVNEISRKGPVNCHDIKIVNDDELKVDNDTLQVIKEIFGSNPALNKSNSLKTDAATPNDTKVATTNELKIDNETLSVIKEIFGSNPALNKPSSVKTNAATPNDTKIANTNELKIDNDTLSVIKEIFGTNPALIKSSPAQTDSNNTRCKQSFRSLITVRGAVPDCADAQENVNKKKKKGKKAKKKKPRFDVRGNFESEYDDLESTTTDDLQEIIDDDDSTTETTTTDDSVYNFSETTPNNINITS